MAKVIGVKVPDEVAAAWEAAAVATGLKTAAAWLRKLADAATAPDPPSEAIYLPVSQEQRGRTERAARRDGQEVAAWLLGLAEREIAPPPEKPLPPPIPSRQIQDATPRERRQMPPPPPVIEQAPSSYDWAAKFSRWAARDQAGQIERLEFLTDCRLDPRVLSMPPDKQLVWCRANLPNGPQRA